MEPEPQLGHFLLVSKTGAVPPLQKNLNFLLINNKKISILFKKAKIPRHSIFEH